MPGRIFILGQTPKSDIPPNIAPKIITPGNYLQIWDSSATLIGQLATVTVFGAILGGIPLSGAYPLFFRDVLIALDDVNGVATSSSRAAQFLSQFLIAHLPW